MSTDQPNAKKDLFEGMVGSLEFFLNPKIFGDAALTRQITDHLIKGDLIVLRDAIDENIAERTFRCLDQFSDWRVYDGYHDYFHFHHHNIYDQALFPPELRWCHTVFGTDATKTFIQGLSQRDCSGELALSASYYLPGDYSLPHRDYIGEEDQFRQVAFIWHLTKHWRSDWGGDFFWCKKGRYIRASFNTLLLFNVGPESYHFVTHVSPHAQSKRLAVSGWWTGKGGPQKQPPGPPNRKPDTQNLIEIV